jgi:cupin 2 domain-containing protein
MDNLFTGLPVTAPQELVDVLVQSPVARLERIVSTAHRTPPGEWYDQTTSEWVAVLRGSAGIRFADTEEVVVMRAGDWIDIPAHRRHRVEWTDAAEPTVWLALHYSPDTTRTTRRAFSS